MEFFLLFLLNFVLPVGLGLFILLAMKKGEFDLIDVFFVFTWVMLSVLNSIFEPDSSTFFVFVLIGLVFALISKLEQKWPMEGAV